MRSGQEPTGEATENSGSLPVLAILSLVVGVGTGLVVAVFRLSLVRADHLRGALIAWAHGWPAGWFFVIAVCAAATSVAAWLVRRFSPQASGSGIPHVEAVLKRELPPAPISLIPVKFFGGLLAIGSGLALGREGPSVQLGADIAYLVGRIFGRGWPDCRMLLAAGAGAGLATAFNAPIAGAVFVLEELTRRFDTRMTIATFGASAAAIAMACFLVGHSPDFQLEPMDYAGSGVLPVFLVLGLVSGLLGVVYNRAIMGTLSVSGQLRRWPVELRAAMVGGAVGLLAWFAPGLAGGGDALTQRALTGTGGLALLPLIFVLRFGLGPLSYAAATPGGLFAPLLVLGAQSGLCFGTVCLGWFPGVAARPAAFAVTGMAAFFTAVVRAPLTGIILAIELTGGHTQLLPMLGACFTAMLVPTLLGNPPIYDSLRRRNL